MGNKKTKKKLKIVLCIICTLIIIAIPICYYLVYISYNHLTVNSYDINSDKINSSVKFVVIGDLHDNTFKDDDRDLLKQIKEQNVMRRKVLFKIACREPRLVRRGSDVKGENGL